MNVALLHNAKAGERTFRKGALLALLKRGGYHARYFPLKTAINDLKALNYGAFVIVAGGDGSVRKVALKLAGTGRALAILPLGTANNIASSLGLDIEPRRSIAGWKDAAHQRIDMGVARGPWGERRFIEGVGLGLIERTIAVIEDIDAVSDRAFSACEDKLHRDKCVLAGLAHEIAATKVRVVSDQKRWREDYLMFEVMNINRAGPALELSASANPGDGWLDLVSATAQERPKLIRAIEKCLADVSGRPILKSKKTRRVRLDVERCEVRLDDDLVLRRDDAVWKRRRRVRIEIEIIPAAVDLLLPRSHKG